MNSTHPKKENIVKIWRDSSFRDIEFLSARYHCHRFPAHEHASFAVGFIELGAQDFIASRSKRFLMPAGSVCAINPGDVHAGGHATETGWQYRMIYIPTANMATILSKEYGLTSNQLPTFNCPTLVDSETYMALRAAHCIAESPDASRLEKTSRLTHAVNLMVKRHGNVGYNTKLPLILPKAIKRSREFIDANIAMNPSLQDIANAAELSPSHFLRSFRDALGMTPHAYLMQRRIAMARHLLVKGEAIRSIAIQTGFSDQAHFSREFRRFYGVTPRKSRR